MKYKDLWTGSHMHACKYKHTHTTTHTHMHTHIYSYMHTQTHTYSYMHTNAHTHTRVLTLSSITVLALVEIISSDLEPTKTSEVMLLETSYMHDCD